MVLGNVEETLTTTEIDEETSEEIIKVQVKYDGIVSFYYFLVLISCYFKF
jgi:hypothetical protein